ncbi:MAG: hypothetical protein JXM79_20320 [Sedimentisphaerales bacterium]|nr:hypothetical protein [Sedimentisphaerales bacterium]
MNDKIKKKVGRELFMKECCFKLVLCSFILSLFLSGFCTAVSPKAGDEISPVENVVDGEAADTNTVSEGLREISHEQQQVEQTEDGTHEAEIEVRTAEKEAQYQQKTVDLEKEKAEVKLEEIELARRQVEIVKETAESQEEIREAVEKAKRKETEAMAAKEKVELAKQAMPVGQEKAKVTEKELEIAHERGDVAESKTGSLQNSTYTKLFQTGLIIVGGYLAIFVLVRIINRRIKDLKLRHSVRKYVVYVLNILIVLYVVFLWVQNISSLTIFLSVISAGIALALQEVILSMAG